MKYLQILFPIIYVYIDASIHAEKSDILSSFGSLFQVRASIIVGLMTRYNNIIFVTQLLVLDLTRLTPRLRKVNPTSE